MVWASLLLHPTRLKMCTDHAAFQKMLHMHGVCGSRAWWRLHFAALKDVIQTQPDASHHAANATLRISMPAGYGGLIPHEISGLISPYSSTAWLTSPQPKEGLLPSDTLAEVPERQVEDGQSKEVRAAMDRSDKSWFREIPNGSFFHTVPIRGAAQVFVPAHICYRVLVQGQYSQAGRPGILVDAAVVFWKCKEVYVYALEVNCVQCAP